MHVSARIDGVSPGGEVWSTTLRFAKGEPGLSPHTSNGDVEERPASDYAAAAEALAELLPGSGIVPVYLRQMMSTALSITSVHVYRHRTSGQIEVGADWPVVPLAGSGQAVRPLQSACVLTLNSGSLYSKNQRGRLYWPAVGGTPPLNAQVQIDAAYRQGFVEAMWQLIGVVREPLNELANSGTNLVPVVFSPSLQKVTRLDSIACDNLLDRQARRQNRVPIQRYIMDVNPTT